MSCEGQTCRPPAKVAKSVRDFDSMLADFRGSSTWRSCFQLVSTLTLFFLSWWAMYWSLSVSYWLTLLLSIPTSLLVVRLFIIQHDCGHRSFFTSRRANDIVGSLLGILTFTPYTCWRREHAVHHACSGDLDRRGRAGDIKTMTVDEYRQASRFERLYYRIYRHPLIMFGLGAVGHFAIWQRFTFQVPKTWKKERRSIHMTNAGLLLLALVVSYWVGPWNLLLIELPIMFISAGTGVWLFYMQHQYEEAFWQRSENWNYVDAAIWGSSYYRLPKILQWFTGSIGLHHIHHLDARIPNYSLQPCYDANPELHQVHEFTLLKSLACMHAKLWDEERGRMVGFDGAR